MVPSTVYERFFLRKGHLLAFFRTRNSVEIRSVVFVVFKSACSFFKVNTVPYRTVLYFVYVYTSRNGWNLESSRLAMPKFKKCFAKTPAQPAALVLVLPPTPPFFAAGTLKGLRSGFKGQRRGGAVVVVAPPTNTAVVYFLQFWGIKLFNTTKISDRVLRISAYLPSIASADHRSSGSRHATPTSFFSLVHDAS